MAINSDELVHFWDHAFRSLLRNPQRLRTVVELCDPDLAARLDFGSATILERTYLTDAYREREADLLFKLNYRAADGLRSVVVCLLIEHQSTVDRWLPLRFLLYISLTSDELHREAERRGERGLLPPVIPLIFYTGSRRWTPPLDFRELVDCPPELIRLVPSFGILFLSLRDLPPAALEAAGAFGRVLCVAQGADADEPEFAARLEAAANALRPLIPQEWRELANFLYLLVTHRRPQAEQDKLHGIMCAVAADEALRQELSKMQESYAETLFKRGRDESLAGIRDVLMDRATRQLGLPTLEQRELIEGVSESRRLAALLVSLPHVRTWEELLRLPGTDEN